MRTKALVKATLLLAIATSAVSSQAQKEAESASSDIESDKPYEIVISGRPTRAHYRQLIQDVEDDFFERFNDLNIDDEYDMYCYEYTPTMSHIKRRACEPMFMLARRAKNSSDTLFMIGGGGGGDANSVGMKLFGTYLESPAEMVKYEKGNYEILVRKMEELTQTDRELGEMADVMEQLKFRLENYITD